MDNVTAERRQRILKSQRRAEKLGIRVLLGHLEAPPIEEGWGAHLAPTVDIVTLQEVVCNKLELVTTKE